MADTSKIIHNHNLGNLGADSRDGLSLEKVDDFLGFWYNGYHSFDLGIKRVSDGSRYSENLLPSLQDKTVQIPGGDGMYFFGSYYAQRQITISIAFDSMTELQMRKLRQMLSTREPKPLVFYETPYKQYLAKPSASNQNLKYVCFDDDGKRIYRGEGTINFVCYYPFATARHWKLDGFGLNNSIWEKVNINEWKDASGLPATIEDGLSQKIQKLNGYRVKGDKKGCYHWNVPFWSRVETRKRQTGANANWIWHMFFRLINPGDFETPFVLQMNTFGQQVFSISLVNSTEILKTFTVELPKALGNSAHIVIDSGKNLIYERGKPSIALTCPKTGEFFNIPVVKKTDSPLWLKIGYSNAIGYSKTASGSASAQTWGAKDKIDSGRYEDTTYPSEGKDGTKLQMAFRYL